MILCIVTTSVEFWSHIWCHSVDLTTYPITSACGIVGEVTFNTVPESRSQCGPITAMSGPGQPHSGTSHSFYCLPDCHGRLADLRTWEELVLLTLTMSSLHCSFPIRTGAKRPFSVTTLGGHGSCNICLWQIAAGRLDHRDKMRRSA